MPLPDTLPVLKTGALLISAPSMDDPGFEKVVVLLTEYNNQGATGFVVNKIFERKFNELVEFRHARSMLMYEGGPVEKESLYFIHRSPDLISGGTPVGDTVFVGGDFKKAVAHLDNKDIDEDSIRLYIGYSGWDPGQLEAELKEGHWIIVDHPASAVFNLPRDGAWEHLHS